MKMTIVTLSLFTILFGMNSCRETTQEKAQDAIEAAAEDTEDNLEKAGEAVEDAAEDVGDAINKAGDEINEEFEGTDDVN